MWYSSDTTSSEMIEVMAVKVRVEIRPGSGGDDAARFAGELADACERFAQRNRLG